MEVSMVNVVYFLSRNGRVEHPHLIRVHHLGRSGVHLRDVKRWLAEIRGKNMPDTFAWSYKRKYRTGYVWQDLMDDDLITPISDDEYVLKGSQVNLHATAALAKQHHFLSLDNSPAPSNEKAVEETPPKSSSATVEILQQDDDGFTTSGASDEPIIWRKSVFKIDAFREGGGKAEKVAAEMDKEGKGGGARIADNSRRSWRNSYAKRATEVLCSVLTCSDNCTAREALHPIRRRRERGWSTISQNDSSRKEKSKRGSEGAKRMGEKGVHPTAFNPAYVPNCSQGDRTFKPEKLHSHMKSSKGPAGEKRIA